MAGVTQIRGRLRANSIDWSLRTPPPSPHLRRASASCRLCRPSLWDWRCASLYPSRMASPQRCVHTQTNQTHMLDDWPTSQPDAQVCM
eukprot:257601-Chlamydomonas_euryale.AAC.2